MSDHTLHDAVELLHAWYPPRTADSWDAVGLVCGDPAAPVRRVLFAVDPTLEVAQEAAEMDADLLVVHHPLFLTPVHGVARTTPKGRTLGVLTDTGCALLTAHTSADRAADGVSAALAAALGLIDARPIRPGAGTPTDKLTVFVPTVAASAVREALGRAGAGQIGDYEQASFTALGEGRFRPMTGANPHIGTVGAVEVVAESRIEVVLPRAQRAAAVAAMLAVHPYEEPAYDVIALADVGDTTTGVGRVGSVAEMSLAQFAQQVSTALPHTAHGVRVGGDPGRTVRRVAVCGGAGDFLLDTVLATDADVYVTSDLRHHPAAEFLEKGGPALVDVSHWAAEWTWLPVVEARLRSAWGDTVETRVSARCTDPWTFRP